MSKLKVSGNASGTGVITLEAPNTNTDRTITLPDGDISFGVGIDDNATSTAITIDASERVNIGDLGLTPDTSADNLSIEGVGAGMSILTHNGGQGKIVFGEQDDTSKAMIGFYSGGTDRLVFSGADSSTEHLAITSDGRGLSQFTAKAWVNFNGTGTVAIRDSHNVSSITDNGTGQYQVNFTNAMANANYCAACSDGYYGMTNSEPQGHQTTHFRVYTYNTAGSVTDTSVEGVVFGD